jgi:hypothetical protein
MSAYISKSVLIDSKSCNDAFLFLNEKNIDVKYWSKGTPYSDSDLLESNVMFILLDAKVTTSHVGMGTFNEILKAKELDIPVYLMYKTVTGNKYQFYHMDEILEVKKDANKYAQIAFGNNITSAILNTYSYKYIEKRDPIDLSSKPNNTLSEELLLLM